MKTTDSFFLFTFLISSLFGFSQNIFLKRDYWKSNPSIKKIESDIELGNSPSQLNEYGFDPICYALLEKANNESIIHLLQKKGNRINKITHDSRTYLFWAAYKNNLEIMNYLVKNGAKTNLTDSHGNTVMNFAASTGQSNKEIYEFCIMNGANPSSELNKNGANTLLILSPYLKGDEMLKYFISKGVDLNSVDTNGNGIFNYTARGGIISQLDLLISKGVDYVKPSNENSNAFIYASQGKNNNLKIFQYLDSIGVNPRIITKSGMTAMHSLPRKIDNLEIYDFFINKGVDINKLDNDGNTVLTNAAIYGEKELISFLLKNGANLNITNNDGQSPLMLATRHNKSDVMKLIISNGGDLKITDKKNNSITHYLIQSFSEKDTDSFDKKLDLLVENNINFNLNQSLGNTLLHEAVIKNNITLIKKLIQFKIPINHKNNNGYTALHLAAMKAKNLEIISFLLNNGADKNIKTLFDESAYDLASENELLKKANIDLKLLM